MRLGSRPCDYRCGVTIQRDRRPGSLPHPEPSRAPDLDLSLHPTLPCPAHSAVMLTVKYREMLAIACAEKSYGEFRFSSESDAWDWSAMRYVSVFSNRSREVWFWVAMCSILPNWLFGLCFLESDICGAGFGFGCPFVCFC